MLHSLGHIFDENGRQQRDIFYFIPPKPIKKYIYLCDKHFRIDFIEDLYQKHADYGILYLNGDEFTFYCLNGPDLFEVTKTTRKKLPRTHRRGGQSQNRIARIRDEAINNYLTKINEACIETFIDENTTLPNIEGFIIIGSGNKKEKFQSKLDARLKQVHLGTFTSERLDYEIVTDTVTKSIRQKNIIMIENIFNDTDKLQYGEIEVIESLKNGLMEIIILTPDMNEKLKKEDINIKEMCEELSCTIYIIFEEEIAKWGGIIGKRWY